MSGSNSEKENARLRKFKPDDTKTWQFISDENDIETIMKKLDLILEHNARVSALYLKTQEDKWLTAALEQDIDILDKKLDWIAEIISQTTRMSLEQNRKYKEIFKDEKTE